MKVYSTNSYLDGCWYVRMLLPLREGGWWGDRTSLRSTREIPERQAKAVLGADIVVFHRPNDDRCRKIADHLKSQGKKIVFDNDDTYKGLDHMKLNDLIFNKVSGEIDKFIQQADLVTCSTEYLAEEYRKLNPNVVVLPNCVDPEDWPEPERNESGKVRIGLIGSVGMNGDTEEIRDILKNIGSRDDVQLVLFSLPEKSAKTMGKVQELYQDDYAYWDSMNVEWHPFVDMADYFDMINELKIDIALIPRKDLYFNRCKSNLKFLECSMLEIPVIAQGFQDQKSPYQVDPEDAQHMIICTEPSEWLPAIERLIADKDLRRSMGQKAKEYVVRKYSIQNNIQKWEQAYEKLLQS